MKRTRASSVPARPTERRQSINSASTDLLDAAEGKISRTNADKALGVDDKRARRPSQRYHNGTARHFPAPVSSLPFARLSFVSGFFLLFFPDAFEVYEGAKVASLTPSRHLAMDSYVLPFDSPFPFCLTLCLFFTLYFFSAFQAIPRATVMGSQATRATVTAATQSGKVMVKVR